MNSRIEFLSIKTKECIGYPDSDLMVGVPFTTPGDINRKVQEEHMRYLVAELDTRVSLINTCCFYAS